VSRSRPVEHANLRLPFGSGSIRRAQCPAELASLALAPGSRRGGGWRADRILDLQRLSRSIARCHSRRTEPPPGDGWRAERPLEKPGRERFGQLFPMLGRESDQALTVSGVDSFASENGEEEGRCERRRGRGDCPTTGAGTVYTSPSPVPVSSEPLLIRCTSRCGYGIEMPSASNRSLTSRVMSQ
jgi:hypothetical protein